MCRGSKTTSHPHVEGLERPFYLVFWGVRGHVEAVSAGSGGQPELLHSVDEVGIGVTTGRRLNDESLVFKCDEASAETVAHVWKTKLHDKPNLCTAKFDLKAKWDYKTY